MSTPIASAIEKMLGVDVPIRAQYIRVMFAEITRMMNHLFWVGAHAMDCGAMNVILYTMRDREDMFDMYEAVSGARMHAAYFRPGGVYRDLPDSMPQYTVSKIKNKNSSTDSTKTVKAACLILLNALPKTCRTTWPTTTICSPTTVSGSSVPWA